MIVHPEIDTRIQKYVSNGLLNTIFYGPKGSGKHTIVLRMLNSLNSNIYEKEKVRHWEGTDITFYSTSTYIRFDAKDCIRKKANLPKIIEEIGRTRDISADSNKVIYIRYLNFLGEHQESFRQLVEDTFQTCRYVFTCRNIDCVDPALNSRCFLVRLPSPPKDTLRQFVKEYKPSFKIAGFRDAPAPLIDNLINLSSGNLNTLKNLILLQMKEDKITTPDVLQIFSKQIFERCKNYEKLGNIQEISEKLHYSEFSILDICKTFPNKHIYINELQNYAALTSPSLYDTMLLVMNICKRIGE
tara:strand:- start:7670 stop:8569 length:900 start_codon:yes stop_codon:yes gene_type:complete